MTDYLYLHRSTRRRSLLRARRALLILSALTSLAFAAPQQRGNDVVPLSAPARDAPGLHVLMSEGDSRIGRALDAPVTLYFSGGLRGFARAVEAASGVRVVLDEKALGAEVMDASPVVVGVQGVSLRSALQSTLAQVDAAYTVVGGALFITSRERADAYQLTRTYYVDDLVLHSPPARDARWWRSSTQPFAPRAAAPRHLSNRELDSWIDLIDVIRETVDPESWGDVGGPGSLETLPSRGALVITHSERVHAQVTQLIATLRKVPLSMDELAASGSGRGISISRHAAADDAIRRALDQPTSVYFSDTPLAEVAKAIEAKHGIPVVVDKSLIDSLGPDTPVTASYGGIKLRSALRLMLSQLDATYTIHNEALCLCTRDASEGYMEIKLYPVRDLVLGPGEPLEAADFDSLLELIRETIEPDSWDDVGGPGSIEPFPHRPCLVIGQTETVHERLAWLLTALRSIPVPGLPPRAPDGEPGIRDSSESEAAIRRTLDEPAVVQCDHLPLSEFVDRLALEHAIPLSLDRSIEDEVGRDIRLSGDYRGLSLGAVLKLLLDPIGATYQVRDETVCIMSKDAAEEHMTSVVYPVADLVLVAGAPRAAPDYADFDSLIDLIKNSIEPDSWDDVGGPGSIGVFPNRLCLCVTQTDEVHERVVALLQQVRKLPPVDADAAFSLVP
jgi:hypothetical protein